MNRSSSAADICPPPAVSPVGRSVLVHDEGTVIGIGPAVVTTSAPGPNVPVELVTAAASRAVSHHGGDVAAAAAAAGLHAVPIFVESPGELGLRHGLGRSPRIANGRRGRGRRRRPSADDNHRGGAGSAQSQRSGLSGGGRGGQSASAAAGLAHCSGPAGVHLQVEVRAEQREDGQFSGKSIVCERSFSMSNIVRRTIGVGRSERSQLIFPRPSR